MKIPFTNINVSKKEAISLGVGAAWAGFTLAFGSAPLSLLTATATPLLTTVITAAAVVTAGFVGKKATDYGMQVALRAENNPDSWYAKALEKVGVDLNRDDEDYNPENDSDDESEYEYQAANRKQAAELAADRADDNQLAADYGQAVAITPASLMQRARNAVFGSKNGYEQAAIDAMPARTLRSGKGF